MPEVSAFIPLSPWHWTTIIHYLLLLGALYLLMASGDNTPVLYLIVVAVMAILVGADLYSNLLGLGKLEAGRLIIFLLRVFIFGIPALIGGLATAEDTRAVAIGLAVFAALPLIAITFLTCPLGIPLGDPRILDWCHV